MKQKFSKHWKASKQPRKQRKYRANAPLHIRHKLMSVHLYKTLREKYGKRNFPIRKGDKVKIMKGEFRKKVGKIDSVDLKKLRVTIEGIYRTKKDGTKIGVYFNASNLQIQELNLEDKKRVKAIGRTKKEETKPITDKKESEQKKEKSEKKEKVKEKKKEKSEKKQKTADKNKIKKQGEKQNAPEKK